MIKKYKGILIIILICGICMFNGILRSDRTHVETLSENLQLTTKSILSFTSGVLIGHVTPDTINVIMSCDFDNNDLNDVVSGDSAGHLYFWQNPGIILSTTSNWSKYLIGTTNGATIGMDLGDVDEDGDIDIVTTDNGKNLTLWLNSGTPFEGSWSAIWVGGTGSVARAMRIADIDNDGDLDICTGNDGRDLFIWWHNQSTPLSSPWASTKVGIEPGGVINALDILDVDHDGDKDIITCDAGCEIRGWRNPGAPWLSWISYKLGDTESSHTAEDLKIGDFDSDENLDLVAVDSLGDISVWRNNGLPWSNLWAGYEIDFYSTADFSYFVLVADFDYDGHVDIASGHANGTLFVWQNIGSPWGTIWSGFTTNVGTPPLRSGVAADFTGTILPDIMGSSEGKLILFINQSVGDFSGSYMTDAVLLGLALLIASLLIALSLLFFAWLDQKSKKTETTAKKATRVPRTKTPAESQQKPATVSRARTPIDPREKHP